MTLSEAALALGIFVVFGSVSFLMFRSVLSDWREGRTAADKLTMFSAVQQAWPAALALLVAIGGPVVLVVS